jgi:hypothetical protein
MLLCSFFLKALNELAADCVVLSLVWLVFIRLLFENSVRLIYSVKLRRVLSNHDGDGWHM